MGKVVWEHHPIKPLQWLGEQEPSHLRDKELIRHNALGCWFESQIGQNREGFPRNADHSDW